MARQKRTSESDSTSKIKKLRKISIRISISLAALLFVVLLAGAIYVYFNPGKEGNISQTPVLSQTFAPIKPTQPSPDAPENASVQFVSSPVARGGEATLSIHTQPGSICTAKQLLGNKSAMADLAKMQADEFGSLSWNWKIDPLAPKGNWSINVTCLFNKRSAVVIANMQVN